MTPALSRRDRAVAAAVAAGVPALLVLGLAFRSGGYPAGVPAAAATLLLLALAARLLVAPATVRRLSGPALVVAAGLAGLTALSLASAAWSGAPARAVTAGARDLLYLTVFATVATLPRPAFAHAVRGLATAIAIVTAVALATRLLPGLFPLSGDEASQRLAFPLSYQNALGLLCGIGILLALHLTSERRESVAIRVLAAAAVPGLVSALYLTQSRGAIGATAGGLVMWLAIGRSRWMLAGIGATALPSVPALVATYLAVELVRPTPSPSLAAQGRAVAAVLLGCTLLAAWLRLRIARDESRWAARALPHVSGRTAVLAVAACFLVTAAAGAVAFADAGGSGAIASASPGDPRSRLVQFTSSGRIELWRGARELFREEPVLGRGADTFQTGWERVRGNLAEATEAHSLYFETLAELGILGLVLVVGTLAGVLACCATAPGSRIARATAVGVAVAWIAHAAVDWDWEMPAVTVVLFALAGAAQAPEARHGPPRLGRATALAAVLVLAAAVPGAWALSQARSDGALEAYANGDCAEAIRDADGALALAPFRPEAHFVRAACLVRERRPDQALAAARDGVRWDRDDFRGAYDAAAVAAALGRDGRGEAVRANRLNRLGPYSNWLPYWLDTRRQRPPQLIAGLAPLLLGDEPYPPILRPYASPPRS